MLFDMIHLVKFLEIYIKERSQNAFNVIVIETYWSEYHSIYA